MNINGRAILSVVQLTLCDGLDLSTKFGTTDREQIFRYMFMFSASSSFTRLPLLRKLTLFF